jgi:hypothetical protein
MEKREATMEGLRCEDHDKKNKENDENRNQLVRVDKNNEGNVPNKSAANSRNTKQKKTTEKVRRGIEITIAMRRRVADEVSPFCVFQCEQDEKQRKKQRRERGR